MRISLRRTLAKRAHSELVNLHDTWAGGTPATRRQELLENLVKRMSDPVSAASVKSRLDPAGHQVLRILLSGRGQPERNFDQIKKEAIRKGIKAGSVRSALAELVSMGLAVGVAPTRDARSNGSSNTEYWAVPREVARALRSASKERLDPSELLTLRGFLERHFRKQEPDAEAAQHARRMYRFLAGESSLCGRIDHLEEPLRKAVSEIITQYGGVIPEEDLIKLGGKGGNSTARLQKALEESSLGTVGDLVLEKFGIRQRGQVVTLFNEAVLAYLRRSAKDKPVTPAATASIGVDFVSNFSRFASFVGDQNVRFTVRGTIFKSTGKRIAESLIPNPGREFRRRDILDLLYRFALAHRYIDRTGERSFMLTEPGHDFLREPLIEKQRKMLDWVIEDRDLPGDLSHQLRLRRTTLRYLKRLEPGVWYDAMFLPFVVRNHYLASFGLEPENPGETNSFPVRSSADLKSLAWNLFIWIRKHLYLLGILDMGYDETGRACAIRLTPMGAELLGMIPGRELEGAGHIVVNPDFEVVLFPEEQSYSLVYELDRFCQRELSDSLYHYRINPGSLHRALSEGMELDAIIDLLRRLSRTPLPQNVVYSLESWARSDGMVTYYQDGRLMCDLPEILDRLQLHPELGRIGFERAEPGMLILKGPVSKDDIGGWVRDFGVSIRSAS